MLGHERPLVTVSESLVDLLVSVTLFEGEDSPLGTPQEPSGAFRKPLGSPVAYNIPTLMPPQSLRLYIGLP